MLTLVPAAVFGLFVGLRHATEADHVAAVSAIVARERTVRGAALIGAAWGLGHTLTLMVLGGAIVVFGLAVPKPVGLALELGVGVMLVALGAWNILARKRSRVVDREHAHTHGAARASSGPLLRRMARPFVVGTVHGLAGSAAAALLVVATVRSTPWGLAYLLVFGLGTMFGMTALTTALALPLGRALRRFERAEAWLRVASGVLSCVVGALVVYEIGFCQGLFML